MPGIRSNRAQSEYIQTELDCYFRATLLLKNTNRLLIKKFASKRKIFIFNAPTSTSKIGIELEYCEFKKNNFVCVIYQFHANTGR